MNKITLKAFSLVLLSLAVQTQSVHAQTKCNLPQSYELSDNTVAEKAATVILNILRDIDTTRTLGEIKEYYALSNKQTINYDKQSYFSTSLYQAQFGTGQYAPNLYLNISNEQGFIGDVFNSKSTDNKYSLSFSIQLSDPEYTRFLGKLQNILSKHFTLKKRGVYHFEGKDITMFDGLGCLKMYIGNNLEPVNLVDEYGI